jgi:VWFA-related protein
MGEKIVQVLGFILAVVSTAICATAAQQPPSAPPQSAAAPYVESFDVEIHNIDVVVTDRRGQPVAGLTQADFEVLEDKVMQPISNFSEFRAEGAALSASSDTSSPAADNVTQSRKFVFIIDDLSLHPQTREKLGEELASFINTMMRNGDEAMIVRPESRNENQIRLRFTANKAAVLAAIDEIIAVESRTHVDRAVDQEVLRSRSDLDIDGTSVRNAMTSMYAADVARRVQKTLAHLSSIVNALAEVPGKKSIIMMTESLPAITGRDLYPLVSNFGATDCTGLEMDCGVVDLRPVVRDIAEEASSNGITIYAFQPEYNLALSAPGLGAESRSRFTPRQDRAARYFQRTVADTQETFEILTERTGGAWDRGHANVDNLLDRIERDHEAYYSIGYRPTSAVANRTRHIHVRIKGRPELRVRTRQDVIRKTPVQEMNDLVVASLMYPKKVDELSIEATAGDAKGTRGTYLVPVAVLPDGQNYRGSFTVHYAAQSDRGDFSSGVSQEQVVVIPAADIETAREKTWTHTSQVRVPKGRVSIAVGVLDPVSRLSSFKTLEVDAR